MSKKVKIGDKKTIYSWAERRVQETETECVGFMPDGKPVWWGKSWDRTNLQPMDLYTVFDGSPNNQGFFETRDETLNQMITLSEMRVVMGQHLGVMVESERKRLEEKE